MDRESYWKCWLSQGTVFLAFALLADQLPLVSHGTSHSTYLFLFSIFTYEGHGKESSLQGNLGEESKEKKNIRFCSERLQKIHWKTGLKKRETQICACRPALIVWLFVEHLSIHFATKSKKMFQRMWFTFNTKHNMCIDTWFTAYKNSLSSAYLQSLDEVQWPLPTAKAWSGSRESLTTLFTPDTALLNNIKLKLSKQPAGTLVTYSLYWPFVESFGLDRK